MSNFAKFLPEPIGRGIRRLIWKHLFKSSGYGLKIYEGVLIRYPENIEVGDNVAINDYCILNGKGGIKIGNNVALAHGVKIYSFDQMRPDEAEVLAPVKIGNDTWVGANAVITKGVTIGNHCIIGASSVVTKNISSNTIAVGIPAKIIKPAK